MRPDANFDISSHQEIIIRWQNLASQSVDPSVILNLRIIYAYTQVYQKNWFAEFFQLYLQSFFFFFFELCLQS